MERISSCVYKGVGTQKGKKKGQEVAQRAEAFALSHPGTTRSPGQCQPNQRELLELPAGHTVSSSALHSKLSGADCRDRGGVGEYGVGERGTGGALRLGAPVCANCTDWSA